MLKILIPTDFSDNAWNAITYALELYKAQQCEFIILHTYTPAIFTWEYVQSVPTELEVVKAVKDTYEMEMQNTMDRIHSTFTNKKHTFVPITSFNTLSLEVVDIQNRLDLDMIVMGSKGATGLDRVLFGSNTIHILKNAKCPVLAIPDNYSFHTPGEILFPSDFEVYFDRKDLKPVIDIASLYGSKINLLHVFTGKALTQRQQENKQQMEVHFKNLELQFHEVSNENVPEAIEEFEIGKGIDLLVMVNNKHSFFENLFFQPVINHIGFHLNIPFLVIPTRS